MESVWSVSKLSTESVGSRRELVANCVHTVDADATYTVLVETLNPAQSNPIQSDIRSFLPLSDVGLQEGVTYCSDRGTASTNVGHKKGTFLFW